MQSKRKASISGTASIAAALGIALAPSVPSIAAAKPNSHKLALTTVFRTLSGTPTGSFTATGTIAGSPLGHGAIVRHVTAAGNRLTVRLTWFGPSGSMSGTASERRIANPNGTVTFTIANGRITTGTGIYHGATGSFSGTGTWPTPLSSSPVTEHLQGAVSY